LEVVNQIEFEMHLECLEGLELTESKAP